MKMKKIATVLLSLIMITSIIPTAVFATDYIREVSVTNVLEPIAGIKWESQWDKSEMTYDNSSYAVFQQPEWYDETEKRFMTPNEVFKVDHIYTVQVWVEANDGYEFDSTVTSYNMKGYINGNEAKLIKRLTDLIGDYCHNHSSGLWAYVVKLDLTGGAGG